MPRRWSKHAVYRIDPNGFRIAVSQEMQRIADGIEGGMTKVIQQACELAKDTVTAYAKGLFKTSPRLKGKYKRGFSYTISGHPPNVEGEVGSKKLAHMVHLLELGHASVYGGRKVGQAAAYPHLAPAADAAFELAEKSVIELVERCL